MGWAGNKIKDRAREVGTTIIGLSKAIGVSRQTVNAWIGGQVPRGQHLIKLCKELGTEPNYFFAPEKDSLISAPQHRTIGNRPVTAEMRAATLDMATQYINLFRSAPSSDLLLVVRARQRSEEDAEKIAARLRELSCIDSDKPMSFEHIFIMLDKLGVYTVFRPFPDNVSKKIYAFYSKIAGQRVIFVNTDTNVIDLKFQLLHETVHAVRDEAADRENTEEEDAFCDLVAGYIQFPEEYVKLVARAVKGCGPGVAINKLKEFSKLYNHSMYGIMKRLERSGVILNINVAPADTNLKKTIPKVSDTIFRDRDPRSYITKLRKLSPRFTTLVAAQTEHASVRKIGEWLGLDSAMDAQAVLGELRHTGDA